MIKIPLEGEIIVESADRVGEDLILITGTVARASKLPLENFSKLFDTSKKVFFDTGSMHISRENYLTTSLSNGNILFSGGNYLNNWSNGIVELEVFNSNTKTYTVLKSTSVPRISHAAIEMQPNKVVMIGGVEPKNKRAIGLVNVIDAGIDSIVQLEPLPQELLESEIGRKSIEKISEDKLLIIHNSNSAMVYNPFTRYFKVVSRDINNCSSVEPEPNFYLSKLSNNQFLVVGVQFLSLDVFNFCPNLSLFDRLTESFVNLNNKPMFIRNIVNFHGHDYFLKSNSIYQIILRD